MSIMGHDEFLKHQARVRRQQHAKTKKGKAQRIIGGFCVTLCAAFTLYIGGHFAVASAKANAADRLASIDPDAVPGARLIGFGCGAERKTLLRMEEDQFPQCEAIESVKDACRIEVVRGDDGKDGFKDIRWDVMTPTECRDFWGDGY